MILTQFQVWPEAGGILDQDPLFLRRLLKYQEIKGRFEDKKAAQEARTKKAPRGR
jgi:hypothetical protein